MVEAVETMDGWYALHDMRGINWQAWKNATQTEREKAMNELKYIIDSLEKTEEKKEGSHAIYQIIGHKADIMFMILKPTMEELLQFEAALDKSAMGSYLTKSYSYFSVIELAKYRPQKEGVDPESLPEIQERLKPILPTWPYISFYPMSRRRQGDDNWYVLEKSERGKMLYEHSLTGRKYAGKVKQFISGSIGFDKWEWGVTLFAHDVLELKKIVYEMRFDEATARFGEFDDFYIGIRLTEKRLEELLNITS